jgi:hypothetical protein
MVGPACPLCVRVLAPLRNQSLPTTIIWYSRQHFVWVPTIAYNTDSRTEHSIDAEVRAAFRRRDHGSDSRTEIAVAPEDDFEVRRIAVTNASGECRTLDVTSYAEIVLAPPATDAAHPAFGKRFVETEIVHDYQAILCKRRPRTRDELTPWTFHLLSAQSDGVMDVSYQTDRMGFIGRGRIACRRRGVVLRPAHVVGRSREPLWPATDCAVPACRLDDLQAAVPVSRGRLSHHGHANDRSHDANIGDA